MVSTPICDFARSYAAGENIRLHMPGHKGVGPLGVEALDLTEIAGADDLFHASGIIAESEKNASGLFGAPTVYSTEGSSLCIRAMLFLAMTDAPQPGKRPWILAGRNAHKSFVNAAALLDLDVVWMYPSRADSLLSCTVTASQVETLLENADCLPCAVYLTSPDYLGNTLDIAAISRVCRAKGVLLLVDNAHGAYLKFLPMSQHPMDLGADMCCDSAHKTLPVLTGGAYLHFGGEKADAFAARAKEAMALFASTSPSYLILQSLDAANAYLENCREEMEAFALMVCQLKTLLTAKGYSLVGDEMLKITIAPKPYGYTGTELGQLLAEGGIVCEFSDPDYLVLMLTPRNTPAQLQRVMDVLASVPRREAIEGQMPSVSPPKRVMTIRQAAFSRHETVPVEEALGRILAAPGVSCPPAIPIAVCGEILDNGAIAMLRYYGIETCTVVAE